MADHSTFDRAKRLVDIAAASILLIVTAPVQGVVALLVARKLGRPVLFRQRRPGLHGESFTLVKFRTMREPDPARGWVTDADRLTPFGRGLRATSLDELPTMWNVVRGDMSLVGPRPLLESYLERYDATQARRHEVRPGVTGLAQTRGRNAQSWDDRLRSDVEYVDARSFRLDLRILRDTVGAVVRRDGVAADSHATMPEFGGVDVARS